MRFIVNKKQRILTAVSLLIFSISADALEINTAGASGLTTVANRVNAPFSGVCDNEFELSPPPEVNLIFTPSHNEQSSANDKIYGCSGEPGGIVPVTNGNGNDITTSCTYQTQNSNPNHIQGDDSNPINQCTTSSLGVNPYLSSEHLHTSGAIETSYHPSILSVRDNTESYCSPATVPFLSTPTSGSSSSNTLVNADTCNPVTSKESPLTNYYHGYPHSNQPTDSDSIPQITTSTNCNMGGGPSIATIRNAEMTISQSGGTGLAISSGTNVPATFCSSVDPGSNANTVQLYPTNPTSGISQNTASPHLVNFLQGSCIPGHEGNANIASDGIHHTINPSYDGTVQLPDQCVNYPGQNTPIFSNGGGYYPQTNPNFLPSSGYYTPTGHDTVLTKQLNPPQSKNIAASSNNSANLHYPTANPGYQNSTLIDLLISGHPVQFPATVEKNNRLYPIGNSEACQLYKPHDEGSGCVA